MDIDEMEAAMKDSDFQYETPDPEEQEKAQKTRNEELLIEAKNFFDFHKKELGESLRKGNSVIFLDFMKLTEFSNVISDEILANPEETLRLIEIAIEESGLVKNVRVRLQNIPDSVAIKIRNIRSKHLNELITIEGIIRQASDVRPQVVNARFECPSCGTVISVLQIEKKFREPTRCSCGRRGGFRLLSKEMVDTQRLVVEESPENLTGGEQPKRLNIFVKEDLVEPRMEEKTTPGARIKVIGILKEVPVPLSTGGMSTRFELAIEANNIIPMEETFEELDINEEDEKQIQELAQDPQIYEKLASSVSPSVWGYEEIKKSLVLQLFGGVQTKRADGSKSRGDIHILLIGDPGVAKSVTLGYMASISPKGRYVVGKSASGAGLTATVVRDEYLKGWSLEAGAMVLAHKGLVCIDELEKMDPQDRSAMHEAMEQQCYSKDLELVFSDGSRKKIGNFVDELMEKNKEKIEKGINCEILPFYGTEKILTTDFESIYPVKIKNVTRHIAPKKLIRIKLNNGREITVTPEHPCWITRNGEIKTIPAINLKEGEMFPIPSELSIEGSEQIFSQEPFVNGPELCKLIGYHITDGCYELNRQKKNGIQFWNNDIDLINDYCNAISSIFGIKPLITKRNHQYSARVISMKIAGFMKDLEGNLMEKGKTKSIPEKIMKCRNEDLAFLLKAAFDGDGTVVNVKRGGCRITLVTENIRFADQISELLLRFGILSSIFKDKNVFRVDISGHENLIKFYQNIGFLSEKKRIRLKNYLAKEKTYRSIVDVIPNVSIEVREILRKLKITDKEIGNQIEVKFNKHRKFLKKIIIIIENKLKTVLEEEEILKKDTNSIILGKIRKNLGISALSMAKKLNKSSYVLLKSEKENIEIKGYKEKLREEIKEMLSTIGKLREIKKLAFGKIRWSKVKEVAIIENKDEKWVYDITVEPTHSFISNNMVLHNSVTISKANVQASLRAETSVLAAANPKFGRFDPYQPIAQQIDLPPTLINRFDIIFTLRDLPDKSKDERIAMHVLQEHKTEVVETFIPVALFRKYIAYAKQRIKPRLTDEAIMELKRFYVDLRNAPVSSDAGNRPIPISARQLTALVRMSEAAAKIRLSTEVTSKDAQIAIELMKYYLMQVGYDYESKTFDIDRISTSMGSSQRSKIFLVRDTISSLEEKMGKLIPMEELENVLEGKLTKEEISDAITKLKSSGDIFNPRRGYIQKT
jgi:replicative DNA helicase Mcm